MRDDFNNATQALSKAYALTQDEVLLDKLGTIYLLFLREPQKTIALYETHLRMYGISKLIGGQLGIIYTESKNYTKAARIYTKLYESFGNQNYAKFALEIYFKIKRLDLAKAFLLKNPKINARDEILLEVYRLQKDFSNSIKQAQLLYQNTHDLNYLAYFAMMSYENLKTFTPTKLAEIERNLETSASKLEDALYWNYLGFLMIEHDFKDPRRIQKGMEYVQFALDKEPQNTYYLDSLAWGYYKLQDCKKAKEIMDKIPQDERKKESEINEHYKKITLCLRK